MAFLEIAGPINADTVYCDNELCAQNTAFSLPEVTQLTTTVKAMGNMDVPIIGQIDAMEASIKKIGIDSRLAKMSTPETHSYELRWAQQMTKQDGSSKVVGCKAFLRGFPKSAVPAFDVEPGESAVEADIPIAVTRYQMYVDGEELWCIDRLAQIMRIRGKDYFQNLDSVL
ncbi:MAG: phage major tail tube protein [Lachnospiraceae bacterium]|nr:phage major tail tube protein [Lachnospiraceae bacterium]